MMYFGTKERMLWVNAPAPGAGFSAVGYSDSIQYQGGGIGVRNSNNAHLEYDMTWNSLTRDEIASIEDYSYGLYGDGLVYFIDPVAQERNLFNAQWAAPKLTAEDGIPLAGVARPAKVLSGNVSLGYPLYAAQYAVTTTTPVRSFYIPIPVGYTLWVGAHGIAQAQGLRVQPCVGSANAGSPVLVPITSVTTSTRFSASIDGSGAADGVLISLNNAATATITIAGMMAQLLPTGQAPQDGGFISGRGNSGCVFSGKLNVTPYSLPGESIGMTGKLIEVGDWL